MVRDGGCDIILTPRDPTEFITRVKIALAGLWTPLNNNQTIVQDSSKNSNGSLAIERNANDRVVFETEQMSRTEEAEKVRTTARAGLSGPATGGWVQPEEEAGTDFEVVIEEDDVFLKSQLSHPREMKADSPEHEIQTMAGVNE